MMGFPSLAGMPLMANMGMSMGMGMGMGMGMLACGCVLCAWRPCGRRLRARLATIATANSYLPPPADAWACAAAVR